jgi:hypothetical protein
MTQCSSIDSIGKGSFFAGAQSAILDHRSFPPGCTLEQMFCDANLFWCSDDNIWIPETPAQLVELNLNIWDFTRRASNHEAMSLGRQEPFAYDELFPQLVLECFQAVQSGESQILLMNDLENIFPFTHEGVKGELLCAFDKGVWTVARRNYPSTAYDAGDRFFRPS